MKWAISNDFQPFVDDYPENYAVYDNKQIAKSVAAKSNDQGLNMKMRNKAIVKCLSLYEWVKHHFPVDEKIRNDEYFMRSYEIFCGGWLTFYEKEIRSIDHTIFFSWDLDGERGEVIIYISPRPEKILLTNEEIRKLKKLNTSITETDPPTPPPPPPPGPEKSYGII